MMSQHGSRPKYQSSVQQGSTMDVFIETLTGTAFEMTVSPFDTVMSIKSKIQRVEGIPVSQQHLLYNLQELDDSSCLLDYSIEDGATLKLVLSMRGGPISTRRLPPTDETTWKELRDFVESNREDVFDHLPAGCCVTVLIFKDGDNVNLFKVIENGDGTYSPLSDSWSGSSIRNLFAEDDPEETAKKLQENSVTMGKMRDLRSKMDALSLQKKDQKKSAPRVLSAKKSLLPVRKGTPRPCNKGNPQEHRDVEKTRSSNNVLQLPPLSSANSSLRFRLSPLNDHKDSICAKEAEISNSTENRMHKPRTYFKVANNCPHIPNVPANDSKKSEATHSHSILTPGSVKNTNKTSTYSEICSEKTFDNCGIQKNYYSRRSLPSIAKQNSEANRSEKQTVNHIVVSRAKSTNVLDTPNIAIVEEEGDHSTVNIDPDFSPPPNAIPVPSKEATTFTLSQVPRERITSVGSGRYRISRIVLDERSRPKTSPEKLTQHEKSTLEMWGILTDSKWNRHRRRSSNCLPSVDVLGFPSEIKNRDLQSHSGHNKFNEEKPVSFRTPLSDFTSSSQRFGRRSVNGNSDSVTEPKNSELHQSVAADKSLLKPLYHPSQRMTSDKKSLLKLPIIETKLPHLALQEPTSHKKTGRVRCTVCKKKLNITNTYSCHCAKKFCSAHRYSELHNCTYDYKAEGRRLLEQSNPLVTAPKLPKI